MWLMVGTLVLNIKDMELKSKTDKRIIIEGQVNGNTLYLLVDTGASVGLIDYNQIRMYGIKKGREFPSYLVGASGRMDAWHCYQLVEIGSKEVGQFLIADIGDVVESIESETGITISGILSLPQMAMLGATIDTENRELRIKN